MLILHRFLLSFFQSKKIFLFLGLNVLGTIILFICCHATNSMGKFSLLLLHVFKSAILGNVGTHRLKLHAVSDIETLMVTSHIVPI